MTAELSDGQRLLCRLLGAALGGTELPDSEKKMLAAADRAELLYMAERHRVLPLLYDVLQDCGGLSREEWSRVEEYSRQTVRQNYRLLFLTKHLTEILENAGIPSVVLKGCGVAAWYPVPELRRAGDVDLLVPEQELDHGLTVLSQAGFAISDAQHANHHVVCRSTEGIDVELHVMPAEPFHDANINARMQELSGVCIEQRVYRDCMGIALPVPPDVCQALQLLLHMLQHFLRAGFGLRLLCDWTVFWNRQENIEIWNEFERLAKSCGIYEFARTVTESCVRFLGLGEDILGGQQNPALAEDFLCDVFASEEFGRSSGERMVIVQGTGLKAYWREFHYQMKMNHPRASKYILLWPALWVITLAVFLRNNRKLNRGSVRDILRSAGDRSRLLQQMGLWGYGNEGKGKF